MLAPDTTVCIIINSIVTIPTKKREERLLTNKTSSRGDLCVLIKFLFSYTANCKAFLLKLHFMIVITAAKKEIYVERVSTHDSQS